MPYHGRFCWFELMANDIDAAQAFYGAVLGWTTWDSGMPGMDYRLAGPRDGEGVAGMMQVMDDGPPPMWTGYVCVDDVDASAAAARAAGATLHREPMDIPDVGRFAIIGDPQGAIVAMLQPLPKSPEPPADMLDAPGRVGWHELHARDWPAAWEFHAPLFRWAKGEPYDMGPMGLYQLFRPAGLERDFGGMMTIADRPAAWLYYFNIEGLDAAIERATAGGGALVHGPHQVPGDQWVAVLTDPDGAAFALISAAR